MLRASEESATLSAEVLGVERILTALHTAILAVSNYLVQIPIQIGPLTLTWGAWTFPILFLLTDLTVRFLGQGVARRVVHRAMLPGLLCAYLITTLSEATNDRGVSALLHFQWPAARIAVASFAGYVAGQLMDIKVFAPFRNHPTWWIAPVCSAVLGGSVDSFCFFSSLFLSLTICFWLLTGLRWLFPTMELNC